MHREALGLPDAPKYTLPQKQPTVDEEIVPELEREEERQAVLAWDTNRELNALLSNQVPRLRIPSFAILVLIKAFKDNRKIKEIFKRGTPNNGKRHLKNHKATINS
jgi:hypothetical protein